MEGVLGQSVSHGSKPAASGSFLAWGVGPESDVSPGAGPVKCEVETTRLTRSLTTPAVKAAGARDRGRQRSGVSGEAPSAERRGG